MGVQLHVALSAGHMKGMEGDERGHRPAWHGEGSRCACARPCSPFFCSADAVLYSQVRDGVDEFAAPSPQEGVGLGVVPEQVS